MGTVGGQHGDTALPPPAHHLSPPRPLASTVNDKLELQECLEHGRIAKVSGAGCQGLRGVLLKGQQGGSSAVTSSPRLPGAQGGGSEG